MTNSNHHARHSTSGRRTRRAARQARVQRSLDGLVASYIRDLSARNGDVSDRAAAAALAADRERAAA
jgi:hypothetical protein